MAVSEEMGAGLMWCGFGCGGVVLVVVEGAGGRFAVGRLRAGGGGRTGPLLQVRSAVDVSK